MMKKIEQCVGCGLTADVIDGETHKYMLSSSKCWSLYGEVLAREYANPDYMEIHSLTVDAYALQHPGEDNQQSNSSIYVHLLSLYAYFVKGKSIQQLGFVKKRAVTVSKSLIRLDPIPRPDSFHLQVKTVLVAEDAEQHMKLVTAWAKSVFMTWEIHHSVIAGLYKKLFQD